MARDNEAQQFTSASLEVDKDAAERAKAAQKVTTWARELAASVKRESHWRDDARDAVKVYECEKSDADNQFNILFSNTETLAPALYNSTPVPVVQRRFKDEDPLGKMAAKGTERTLKFLIDPGEAAHAPFDDLMTAAVLDALVPGRGVTFYCYEPTFKGDGDAKKVAAETVMGEAVPWERFRMGYGRSWKEVPWVAREILYTREEAEDEFGEEKAKKLPYERAVNAGGSDDENKDSYSGDATAGTKVAQVFQIWDKATRKVLWIATGYPDGPLKEEDDPLRLKNFFPCPCPLTLIGKVSGMVPVTLYKTYKTQADELNRITFRINKLIGALKVRGLYDSQIANMPDVLKADDNVLLPADNVATLVAQGNSLDKSLWLVPIGEIIKALNQLYLARDQVKNTIFEINGIADIMRGSSQASETLGAQEIKNQWGTLRLKRSQKLVANYVRSSLRLMAEIAMTHFDEETLQKMTGLPYPTQSQKVKLQTQVAQMVQMAQTQPPPPVDPNAPPGAPPPPNPMQQQIQQAQAQLQQPSWKDILDILKDNALSAFRIDIETNSTVDAEATEDKQNITDLINAMAQFLNGVAPLVENGTMPFDVAKQILLTIVRRFRFGPELEDALQGMKTPEPKPDPKAQAIQAKAEADQKMMEQKGKIEMDKHNLDMQKANMDMEVGAAKVQQEKEIAQLELQIKREELQLKREEMGMKRQQMIDDHQMKQMQGAQQMEMANAQHGMQMQTLQATTDATLNTTKAKTDATLAQAKAKQQQANAPKPKPAAK